MRKHGYLASGLKAGAGALLLLIAAGWNGGTDLVGFAARADALSLDQVTAIRGMVQTALASVDPNLTGAAKQQAIAAALGRVLADAVRVYGPSAISAVTGEALTAGVPIAQVVSALLPAAVTISGVSSAVTQILVGAVQAGASATQTAEAIIAVSVQSVYDSTQVGLGLGAAAAQLAQTNASAADQIATVIANEGTPGMGKAYADAVVKNGGSQQLADAGQKSPTATSEIGGAFVGLQTTNPIPTPGTGGTALPPCPNPSCT